MYYHKVTFYTKLALINFATKKSHIHKLNYNTNILYIIDILPYYESGYYIKSDKIVYEILMSYRENYGTNLYQNENGKLYFCYNNVTCYFNYNKVTNNLTRIIKFYFIPYRLQYDYDYTIILSQNIRKISIRTKINWCVSTYTIDLFDINKDLWFDPEDPEIQCQNWFQQLDFCIKFFSPKINLIKSANFVG